MQGWVCWKTFAYFACVFCIVLQNAAHATRVHERQKLLIGYLAGAPFGDGSARRNAGRLALIVSNENQTDGKRRIVYINTNTTVHLKELAQLFQDSNFLEQSKNLQGHVISGAMRYAIEKINNDSNILPNHELVFKFYNTQGLVRKSVKAVMDLYKEGAVAVIGPEDSCRTEALMASAVNIPMISYKCAEEFVADEATYGTFIRTVPSEAAIAKAAVALLKHNNWNKFTLVRQETEVYKHLADGLLHWVGKERNMMLQNVSTFSRQLSSDTRLSSREVANFIEKTYRTTRIYVVIGDVRFLQIMLLEMNKRNLLQSGDYAVVFVDEKPYVDADDAAINHYFRPTFYRSDYLPIISKLMNLSRSLFVVVSTPVAYTDEYAAFWNTVVQYNSEEPFFLLGARLLNGEALMPIRNRFASYLYDAVMLYAEALHETIQANESYADGRAIKRKMLGKKYRSMQGFEATIDRHGYTKGNFTLLTHQRLTESAYNLTHSMIPTGHFLDSTNDRLPVLQLYNGMEINWVGGKAPLDQPVCGFNNELCPS